MTMESFVIKRGNNSPSLVYALIPNNRTLAGASVQFRMRKFRGDTVIDSPAFVENFLPPIVRYDWQVSDTLEDGKYEAEFEVTFSDGAIETYPSDTFIPVLINRGIPPRVS
jgi:hypothetical protein